jgi:hypothetical protein
VNPADTYTSIPNKEGSYNQINIPALVAELKLDYPLNQLGFREQSFDTCAIESNLSSKPQCQRLYLVRVNYHILCRNSTGTVDRVRLTPMDRRKLSWKYKGFRGLTTTTSQGMGSVGFISPKSSLNGHLYLYKGRRVARKSFQDQWKMVLPKEWCDP